ncbi:MAG: hypothetical protein MUF00_09130 [Gemmatimonadaceae bacterium]|jgi:hypothetical protein|nr:hypothetical protein [Gemmatimonadaceae bacterium]
MTTGAARWLAPLVVAWALLGPLGILVRALRHLAPSALAAVAEVDRPSRALSLLLACGLMAWLEGYRGFQRRAVPRMVHVAFAVPDAPAWKQLLAPLIALDLVGVPRARLMRRWLLVGGIIALIRLVRALPDGIRDQVNAAVFTGLAWGLVALLIETLSRVATPRAAVAP